MIPLAELFPLEDYRFHLTLRAGDLREFFAPSSEAPRVLAERRHWLQTQPERYAQMRPEAAPVLAEWIASVGSWGGIEAAGHLELGERLEPDFVLLTRDATGDFRLRGGVVVFPSSWSLPEKVGLTLDEIHGVVPGLNQAMAPPIRRFLERLSPGGRAFLRSNWGLAATDALNLHPSQPRPPLVAGIDPARVWVRVEHQILAALPISRGIVFGIRLALKRTPEPRPPP